MECFSIDGKWWRNDCQNYIKLSNVSFFHNVEQFMEAETYM